jgi:hypothetical protein
LVSCAYCACIVRQNPMLVSSRCLKAETLTRLSAEMGKREDGGIVLRETNHRNGSALLFYAEGLHLTRYLFLALRDGLRRFYFFSVFAEPSFAVAPGTVMKRLLRTGHIRRIALPSFEHRSL